MLSATVLNSTIPMAIERSKSRVNSSELALNIRDLNVTFDGQNPLYKNLNLSIKKGERLAIIGSNGAGKSTLMRACLGIIDRQAAEVSFFGENLNAGVTEKHRRRVLSQVSFVHQKHNIMGCLTVLTNVLHGALSRTRFRPLCWSQVFASNQLREQAMQYLEMVGLADFAMRRAGSLSGGQAQRVAIARSLMQRPKLLVADEPVASLDPVAGAEVMALFAKLSQEQGMTLIFISHHLSHAVKYADRIIGLRNGQVDIDVAASDTTVEKLGEIYDYS